MQIYANFYLIMLIYAYVYIIMLIYAKNFWIILIYETFMKIFMKLFDKAKKPWQMSNKLFEWNVKLKSSTLKV